MITVFTSIDTLTKCFTKQPDGTILEDADSSNLYKGTFENVDIGSLIDLKNLIESLSHKQAISSTVCQVGKGKITTRKQYQIEVENGTDEPDKVPRTKDFFKFQVGPGVLMVDADEDGTTEADVIKKLGVCYPAFKDASYLYVTSSSHGINGKCGFHLYFIVDEISIVKQCMNNLLERSFKHGYGYFKVDKVGSLLKRTFFDNAVYDNARLDFISGPVCNGFNTPARDIRIVTKNLDTVDLSGLLEPVDASAEIQTERDKVAPKVHENQMKEAKRRGVPLKTYQKSMEERGVLHSDFVFPDGTKVSDLIEEMSNNPKDRSICHPIDFGVDVHGVLIPLYEDKTKIYWNQNSNGVPVIHSFKHGGQKWSLDVRKKIIKRYLEHPETDKVIELMRETYSKRDQKIPEKTLRPFIDLLLHQILEDEKGCYSITLRPSGGKTQTVLHVAWFLSKYTKKSMSITFQQIEDIELAYEFLKERDVDCERIYSGAIKDDGSRVTLEDLQEHQIILHTHFKVRDNQYTEKYFRYRGKERDGFVFDEAYFGTLYKTMEISKLRGILEEVLSNEERKSTGQEQRFLKDLQVRLRLANRLLSMPNHPQVDIEFPYLDPRVVERAWWAKEYSNELHTLYSIATAKYKKLTASNEKGSSGALLLMFKVNQTASFEKLVTTDATRDERYVHSLSPQEIYHYDIPQPPRKPDLITVVPYLNNSKGVMLEGSKGKRNFEFGQYMILQTVIEKFCKEIDAKKPGIVMAKSIPFVPSEWPEGAVQIPYGRHKQTDEFSECDAICFFHLHRLPDYAIKHLCIAESQGEIKLESNILQNARIGQLLDDTIQAIMRGRRRRGERCPVFIPITASNIHTDKGYPNDSDFILKLMTYFPEDQFELYELDDLHKYLRAFTPLPKKRIQEKKYETEQERNWMKKFRMVARKDVIEINEEVEALYLRDRRAGLKIGPKKWLSEFMTTKVVNGRNPFRRPKKELDLGITMEDLLGPV